MALRQRKRSDIWNFFTDLGDGKAKCNFCSKQISYKSGSTFNLARQVRNMHPANTLLVECLTLTSLPSDKNPDNPAIIVISSNNEGLTTSQQSRTRHNQTSIGLYFHKPLSNKRNQEIDFLLLETVIENYLPFQIVESRKLRKLIEKLNAAYKLPTRKTLATVILPQLYNMTKETVKEQLQSAEYVTVTTDGWTSIKNESYLSMTAHFIKDMQLVSYLLENFKYDAKHTAQNLAEELKRVTREWGLQDKIVCIVSDNAANIVAAIRLTGWKHIPCFAHNLNLIVQSGLHCIGDITARVKGIVEFFKRSPQAAIKLRSMQEQLGEPVLGRNQDIVTRWNSTFDMF